MGRNVSINIEIYYIDIASIHLIKLNRFLILERRISYFTSIEIVFISFI
ncbi:MAG: hypothetical protein OP8BY_1549 [Candidatus Saccharicenans subterraneus]|uniref:Uncharacterized protein n=1 Tax=Candidatus Saccharicenans subterraneus TaxID=2508984 RepID=A0A3E2BNU2_9BACT|nr:MAG: hypothetical protein OP8BY_1549 [Candidatus Saccharicenans subterraneum]